MPLELLCNCLIRNNIVSGIKPCLCDEKKALKFDLEFSNINKIGRGTSPKASNITINLINDSVSSNHATIKFKNGEWIFCDESSHGSLINNNKIHNDQIALQHKDTISIGEYQFVFFDENAIGIIGGTQKISPISLTVIEKASQISTPKKRLFEEWQETKNEDNPMVAFVCIILFLILFIGIFFNFLFEL